MPGDCRANAELSCYFANICISLWVFSVYNQKESKGHFLSMSIMSLIVTYITCPAVLGDSLVCLITIESNTLLRCESSIGMECGLVAFHLYLEK